MSSQSYNIYTIRPDGTSLWVPSEIAASMGLKRGDKLTADQYGSRDIQGLIERRRSMGVQAREPETRKVKK